jgi:hypothetical protein
MPAFFAVEVVAMLGSVAETFVMHRQAVVRAMSSATSEHREQSDRQGRGGNAEGKLCTCISLHVFLLLVLNIRISVSSI